MHYPGYRKIEILWPVIRHSHNHFRFPFRIFSLFFSLSKLL